MLPRYNNNIATLRKQYCHATTTMLPRYDNVATLRQYCHATTTMLLRKQYCHATIMSRNGQKMS